MVWFLGFWVFNTIQPKDPKPRAMLITRAKGEWTFPPDNSPGHFLPGKFPLPTRTIPSVPLKTQLELVNVFQGLPLKT